MLDFLRAAPREYVNREKIILRDYLALERTRLANERTLFSYLRTAIYILLAGLTLFQIRALDYGHLIGYLAIGISLLMAFIGLVRYRKVHRRLMTYYDEVNNDSL
jgi:putative membrane protein